ncbi:hypothetical protein NDU88_004655 [Pleurodeles waltl]|uniref:Uncharacterized protein n=1 Tax=Pleurodeles waltl TaxID=8319 RepID=A0AAV7MUI1_PLEWA|nr:hypothetical protein NDU88_004655 [Pleurodeles waltl]
MPQDRASRGLSPLPPVIYGGVASRCPPLRRPRLTLHAGTAPSLASLQARRRSALTTRQPGALGGALLPPSPICHGRSHVPQSGRATRLCRGRPEAQASRLPTRAPALRRRVLPVPA